MALKKFQFLSCMFFLSLVFSSTIGHAKRDTPGNKNPSPFDFLKKLEGCHKGDKSKDVHLLKNYLKKFGYLDVNQTLADDDNFDDALELAVKTYQQNYHIKPTGIVDSNTVSKMTTSRCGVPDIINGTNSMQTRKKSQDSSSEHIHTVSHFSFFQGNPRWPPTKTHLTYGFLPNTDGRTMSPVARAFDKWDSATHFTFSLTSYQNADLVIGFHRGNHNDGSSFDGPGGILAHAFAPTDGRFHYDADERWSIGPVPGAHDLETVALHEIGHLLGLGHSSVVESIMYSEIRDGVTKNLHADDLQGIKVLYNV